MALLPGYGSWKGNEITDDVTHWPLSVSLNCCGSVETGPNKKTKVCKGAKLRRLEEKKQRGILKSGRSGGSPSRIRRHSPPIKRDGAKPSRSMPPFCVRILARKR